MSQGPFSQDPDAVLDYLVNWNDWLDPGDFIIAATAFSSNGIKVLSNQIATNGLGHTVWISSGFAPYEYTVTSRILTNDGRKNDQSWILRIEEH